MQRNNKGIGGWGVCCNRHYPFTFAPSGLIAMRVFLYARVSMENIGTKEAPDEREQNPEAQLAPMREDCKKRGWEIVGEFIDRQTGTEMYRPEFKRMMEEVGRTQMIMVWRADRFSRFSPLEALGVIEELHARKIGFYSFWEPYASDLPENTTPEDMRLFLLHLSFMNAKGESKRISDRTKAGIAAKKDICARCGHTRAQHPESCACGVCDCFHFKPSWKGGRPKGSLDKEQRKPAQPKQAMTPSDLFKPTA